uniref:Hexosyltransferase n=1 Tax=Latimeria chalumnae TaxID=7897 RepID=H3AK83_LATCH
TPVLWSFRESEVGMMRKRCGILLLTSFTFSVIFYMNYPRIPNRIKDGWWAFYHNKVVYPTNFKFLINNESACKTQPPFLVILVQTGLDHFEARMMIRESWASRSTWSNKTVLTFFLLGKSPQEASMLKIQKESTKYRDVLQQDFLDTYYNLTHKTRMGLQWMAQFCPEGKFLLKTDGDVFINTEYLVNFLNNLEERSVPNFYTGFPFIGTKPHRWKESKFFLSKEEYSPDSYPPYCAGLGYLLSGHLTRRIFELSLHVKPVKFEDVYIGVCIKLLRVGLFEPQPNDVFHLYKVPFDVCRYAKLIAVHAVSPSEQRSFWNQLVERDRNLHY